MFVADEARMPRSYWAVPPIDHIKSFFARENAIKPWGPLSLDHNHACARTTINLKIDSSLFRFNSIRGKARDATYW